ncbi:MAG: hypothetical protein NUW37_14260 [Planctomycetes bacterium]|nr:hypothetical protein [Planctomycetota bacterium]
MQKINLFILALCWSQAIFGCGTTPKTEVIDINPSPEDEPFFESDEENEPTPTAASASATEEGDPEFLVLVPDPEVYDYYRAASERWDRGEKALNNAITIRDVMRQDASIWHEEISRAHEHAAYARMYIALEYQRRVREGGNLEQARELYNMIIHLTNEIMRYKDEIKFPNTTAFSIPDEDPSLGVSAPAPVPAAAEPSRQNASDSAVTSTDDLSLSDLRNAQIDRLSELLEDSGDVQTAKELIWMLVLQNRGEEALTLLNQHLPPGRDDWWRNSILVHISRGLGQNADALNYSRWLKDELLKDVPVRLDNFCPALSISGLGQYTQVDERRYRRGERIDFYVEVSYVAAITTPGNPSPMINIEIDLDIFGEEGARASWLSAAKELTANSTRRPFRYPKRESNPEIGPTFHLAFPLDVPQNAQPGKYEIELIFRDLNRSNIPAARSRTWFEVR